MSSGGVEEVGARLLVEGGAEFKAQLDEARASYAAFNDEQLRGARIAQRASQRMTDAQDVTVSALDKTDSAMTAATDRLAAFNAEQARAAEVSKASAASVSRSQKVMADAMAGGASGAVGKAAGGVAGTWKNAAVASGKIVKWGMLGATAIAYEGMKSWMSFQQMVAQGAIDAGLKASQIPGLERGFLKISNASGIAAGGVNGVADAAYRLASSYPGMHLTNRELLTATKYATQLGVLAGQTGNMDQIARAYGAVISNGMSIRQGGKALGYSSPGMKKINEWMLAVTGHGDVKMGDLISALGTGVLPLARTFGVSMNQMGAAFDVLSPAMNAASAATRLKTALAMMAAPSMKASQGFELFGGNIATAGSILRTKGLGGLLGYLGGMFGKQVTGGSFYSQFYGGGLGTYAGGSKGKATGAIAYMKALGLTNGMIGVLTSKKGAQGFLGLSQKQLVADGFGAGTSGRSAMMAVETALLSGMFGGGRTGAAIMQLVNERGVYATKLSGIRGAETPTAYEKALKIAYNEPIRQWDIFWNKLKNLTIYVGQDITPAFDGLLHTLEGVGRWLGHNKWALKGLLGAAGAVFAGAAAIKTVEMVRQVYHGAAVLTKVATTPIGQWRTLMTGGGALDGSAARLTGAAAALDEAALALKEGAAGRGIAGTAASGAAGAAGGAEGTALKGAAGAGGASVLGRLKSKLGGFDMVDMAAGYGLWTLAGDIAKQPLKTSKAMSNAGPKWLGFGWHVPGSSALAGAAHDAMSFAHRAPGMAFHDVTHGVASAWDWITGKHSSAATHPALRSFASSIAKSEGDARRSLTRTVSEMTAAAEKAHTAAEHSSTAADHQQSAVDQFGEHVSLFGRKVDALSTQLDPTAVHAKAKAGMQHAVARK